MTKIQIILNVAILNYSISLVLGMQTLMLARKGYRLEGKTFQFIEVSSLTECGHWCLRDQRCHSVNFGSTNSVSELAICELNNSTKERTNSLKYDRRFTYYENFDPKSKEPENTPMISPVPISISNRTNPPTIPNTTPTESSTPHSATSCSYYMHPNSSSGVHIIFDTSQSKTYKVYCHFDHKRKKSWTLVLAFALAYNEKILGSPFWMDKPYSQTAPNFELYRMSLQQMKNIRDHSIEWRAFCNYKDTMLDELDTVRGDFKELDTLQNGNIGSCKKVKYVNIRGRYCQGCAAMFFQSSSQFLHIDSSKTSCYFNGGIGSVKSEDNFGFYKNINPKFSCSSNNDSTTSWWFGK